MRAMSTWPTSPRPRGGVRRIMVERLGTAPHREASRTARGGREVTMVMVWVVWRLWGSPIRLRRRRGRIRKGLWSTSRRGCPRFDDAIDDGRGGCGAGVSLLCCRGMSPWMDGWMDRRRCGGFFSFCLTDGRWCGQTRRSGVVCGCGC